MYIRFRVRRSGNPASPPCSPLPPALRCPHFAGVSRRVASVSAQPIAINSTPATAPPEMATEAEKNAPEQQQTKEKEETAAAEAKAEEAKQENAGGGDQAASKEAAAPVPPKVVVHKANYERDVVYLYQFSRTPLLPSLSPYCLKVETWLRLAGIKYEVREPPCFVSRRERPRTNMPRGRYPPAPPSWISRASRSGARPAGKGCLFRARGFVSGRTNRRSE